MSPVPPDAYDTLRAGIPPTFHWPLKMCLAMSAATYVLSIITGNVSQVDRIWTFMPWVYAAYWALLPLWPNQPLTYLFPYTPPDVSVHLTENFSPRALLMLGLITLWMFRLSYNTYRRGLFSFSDEDYRWAVLRKEIPPWLFQLTNLVFISFIQNVILFFLGLPVHVALVTSQSRRDPNAGGLATSDYILAALSLLTLALEFTADNQQYAYQTWKHSGGIHDTSKEWPFARRRFSEADRKRGFLTRGLWAWSRHPNFLCEQTFWTLMTFFPLLSPAGPSLEKVHFQDLNANNLFSLDTWAPLAPLTPALVISTLFYSSTLFTEKITRGKYPTAYAAYQRRVGMFDPVRTIIKGLWLSVRGEKAQVDEIIYGDRVKVE